MADQTEDTQDPTQPGAPAPTGPAGGLPPIAVSPEERQAYHDDAAARSAPPARPAGFGDKLSSFWDSIKGAGQTAMGAVEKTGNAIDRGAADFVDNTSNAIVGTGGFIVNKAVQGAQAVTGDKSLGADWQKWYNSGDTSQINPLQIGEDTKDALLGKKQGGVYNFVENATAFTASLETGNELSGVKALLPGAVKFLARAGLMGLATAASTDPRAARLSDMVENGPPVLSNPLTRFLKSDGTDSEALARLKSGLEGTMTGAAINGFLAGVSELAGKMLPSGATAAPAATDVAEIPPTAPSPVTVKPLDDGTFTLSHSDAPATSDAATTPGPVFTQVGDAESHAAAMNETINTQAIPTGHVDDSDVSALIQAVKAAPEGGSLADIVPKGAFNYNYLGGTQETQAVVQTLADRFQESFVGLKNRVADGLGIPKDDMLAKVTAMVNKSDADSWVGQARSDADALPEIQARQMARKVVMNSLAGKVSELSQAFDVNPGNAIALTNLKAATDQLLHLSAETSGIDSGAGRLLQSLQNTIPELKSGVADTAAGSAKSSATAGAAEASAVDPAEAKGALAELKEARASATKPATGSGPDNPSALPIMDPENVRLQNARLRAMAILRKANGPDYEAAPPIQGSETMGKIQKEGINYDKTRTDADAQRTDPITASPEDKAAAAAKSKPQNPVLAMAHTFDQMEADLDKVAAGPKPKAAPAPGTAVDDYIAANSGNTPPLGTGSPFTKDFTPKDWADLARQIRLSGGDASLIQDSMLGSVAKKAAETTGDTGMLQKLNAYRINALLSGPKTSLVLSASQMLSSVQTPVEYWLGGLARGNTQASQMGADMLSGWVSNASAAWKVAAKAWSLGESVLDGKSASLAGDEGIANPSGAAATGNGITDKLLTTMKVPTRVIMTVDEFFKNVNYLNSVRGLSMRAAREDMAQMGPMTAEQRGQFMSSRLADDLRTSTDPTTGHALNPVALNYARDATFQRPLEGAAADIQDFVQKHPLARLVVPFVRTPINLARYAWQRTPLLGMLSSQMQDDLAAGGDRAASAMGKQAVGAGIWGSAAYWTSQGNMTGAGPTDPELRQQWLNAGHQPYSIRLPGTNEWMSYRRIDQLGTPMSLIADISEMSGEMHQTVLDNSAGKFLAAVSRDVTSKSFLTGMSTFADAFDSGDPKKARSLIEGMAGSMIPAAGRQLDPTAPDAYGEIRGLLDQLKERVPGFSTSLEARRNILGEKVMKAPGNLVQQMNPFTLMPGGNIDPVQDQMVALGKGMSMPKTDPNGVDLTDRGQWKRTDGKSQSPYDRMLELMGTPKDGSPSVREQLTTLMTSPAWAQMGAGTDMSPGGERYAAASAIIKGAQSKAFAETQQEYPGLTKALQENQGQKAKALAAPLTARPSYSARPSFLTPQ
jgi:hypothetical protein